MVLSLKEQDPKLFCDSKLKFIFQIFKDMFHVFTMSLILSDFKGLGN